jgi:hypothetical protein
VNTFVEIPRDLIEVVLFDHGFTRDNIRGEIRYSRKHAIDPRLSVVVFTSIPENGEVGRGCGEDAIRVVGLLTWTRQGEPEPRRKKLYAKRVYRVGTPDAVMTRMVDRMREAYGALNEFRKENK